jgi:hypothetical protein
METIIGLYCKGNEIIPWRSWCVGSRLVLSGNCCYMCYHRRSLLHQICTSQSDNDNVCQSLKIVSSDDNIHSSPCMVGEKSGKPFFVRELHFSTRSLQQYLEAYHGLQCIHCCTGSVANGYSNHQWYDHIDIVKDAQL